MKKINKKSIYDGKEVYSNAICFNCGKTHCWDEENCEVYNVSGIPVLICDECYEKEFGTCNKCGKLFKYIEMNKEIICKKCST